MSSRVGELDWDVENVRLSIFHPSTEPRPEGQWARLVGAQPTSIDSRPHERIINEQGSVGGNTLLLTAGAQRLDWQFVPIPAQPTQPLTHLQRLEGLEQAIQYLREALVVSLASRGQVDRLAFGAVLIKGSETSSEALQYLARYLPALTLDSAEASDFRYQVNRRRRSASVPHVIANRIAQWQVGSIFTGEVTINTRAGPFVGQRGVTYVSRLILDISSAPENNAIGKDRMVKLFDEFIAMGLEIAIEGDIP